MLVYVLETRVTQAGMLFTATSILTGLTFSMTTTFWSRSVDARKDPSTALKLDILRTLDDTRDHLIFTVAVGLLATGTLALVAIFTGATGAPPLVSALSAGSVIYLLTLVAAALLRFRHAALLIR